MYLFSYHSKEINATSEVRFERSGSSAPTLNPLWRQWDLEGLWLMEDPRSWAKLFKRRVLHGINKARTFTMVRGNHSQRENERSS